MKLNGIYGKVVSSFSLPSQEPTHEFQPRDVVIICQLNRIKKQNYPFGPPTSVVTVTRTTVLTEQSGAWIHTERIKKVPQRTLKQDTDKGGIAGDANPRRASEKGDNKTLKNMTSLLSPQTSGKALCLLFMLALMVFLPTWIITNCILLS